MHRATPLSAVLLLAAVALSGCGQDTEAKRTTVTATGTQPATAPVTTPLTPTRCQAAAVRRPGREEHRLRPSRRLDPKKTYTATLDTNCGRVRIRLDVKGSPETTASFVALARDGFYDGLTFHRISKPGGRDFVVQGGDPTGTGNGGPGYSVVERPPRNQRYRRGVVAMAKTEIEKAGTSGSQFFIVTARDSRLPAIYAVLGRVVGSMEAVDRIAAAPADPTTEVPVDPIVIRKVTVEES